MKHLGEEDRLHMAVRQYLAAQYPGVLALHYPAEGRRSVWEQMKAKRLGLRAGVSDWLIFAPPGKTAPGLALELKSAKGRVTEHQKQFMEQIEAGHGWRTAVARDFEQAKYFIDEFLN